MVHRGTAFIPGSIHFHAELELGVPRKITGVSLIFAFAITIPAFRGVLLSSDHIDSSRFALRASQDK